MLEFLSKEPNQMALLFAAIGDLALLASWLYSIRSHASVRYMMPHLDA